MRCPYCGQTDCCGSVMATNRDTLIDALKFFIECEVSWRSGGGGLAESDEKMKEALDLIRDIEEGQS